MDNNYKDSNPAGNQLGSIPHENTVPLRSERLDVSEDTSKISVQKANKPNKSKTTHMQIHRKVRRPAKMTWNT